MSAFGINFGKRVRALREKQGLSQEALADASGLHRTHISLIERGKRSVRLETIEALAKAFGVQPANLMPETSIRAQPKSLKFPSHPSDPEIELSL